jgi:hypothetical protein
LVDRDGQANWWTNHAQKEKERGRTGPGKVICPPPLFIQTQDLPCFPILFFIYFFARKFFLKQDSADVFILNLRYWYFSFVPFNYLT